MCVVSMRDAMSDTHMCYHKTNTKKKTHPTYYVPIANLFSTVQVQIISWVRITPTPRLVDSGGHAPEALGRKFEHFVVVTFELHQPLSSILVVIVVFGFV